MYGIRLDYRRTVSGSGHSYRLPRIYLLAVCAVKCNMCRGIAVVRVEAARAYDHYTVVR